MSPVDDRTRQGEMSPDLKSAPTKSQATNARIIAMAKSLFVSRNYAEVTTDMIARAAEVTKGGLYHHFSSKEQLYITMMLDDLEHKHQLFGEAVAMTGSCRDRLARLTGDYLRLPAEERELTHLVRRDINSFSGEERQTLVQAYQQALPRQVQAIIEDGIRDRELAPGDARILAWSFVALVEVIISDYAGNVFPSVDAGLDHVLGLFFHGTANPT
ncbi:MAG: TetR/AcrR family transcriptional regulator [Actinomycetia bacterium]|nr:TetR/AcrR family transcriptional regulator [Actinomycetes bacterium]